MNPFVLTGPEGLGAPRVAGSRRMGVSHIHFGIAVPPFAKEFGRGTDPYTHLTSSGSKNTRLWEDPDRHSFAALQGRGGIMESLYQGDHSHQQRLLEEAIKRFESIADNHPDSFLAKYIRWSREENIRFFPRTLVAYQLWKDGLLEEKVAETVKEYLNWHSNVNIGMFLPYPNVAMKERYIRPTPDSGKTERLRALWNNATSQFQARNNTEAIALLKEYQKEASIGLFGDFGQENWTERILGIAHTRSGEFEKAVAHSLAAYGIMNYSVPQRQQLYERGVHKPLEASFFGLNMPQLSEHFKKKSYAIK